jgi:hypothetical protein
MPDSPRGAVFDGTSFIHHIADRHAFENAMAQRRKEAAKIDFLYVFVLFASSRFHSR